MKTLMYRLLLVVFCLSILACSKKDKALGSDIQLRFYETLCANPWQLPASNKADFNERFVEYWNDGGLKVCCFELIYDTQAVEECEACTCQTGNVFYLNARTEEGASTLEDLGFERL